VDSNPFLEEDETAAPAEQVASIDANDDHDPSLSWSREGGSRPGGADGGGVVATLMATTSFAGHLLGQLNVMPLADRDWTLAAGSGESLAEDGYLRSSLDEIAQALALLPAPDPQEMMIALRLVQSLDPAGIGARSVAECLQLQVPAIPPVHRELAGIILRDHMDALAAHDSVRLSRRLGRSAAEVDLACAAIRRLDPRPGWRYGSPATQYVTPDVIVRKRHGKWTATLNEAVVPQVRLNRAYADLFRRHREAQHAELGANLQEARWTVRNVEQRFSTILSVAKAILKRQQHFLSYGAMAMKPMALREIADEVGVHESTVSRVTCNKYMATPCGVFEMKYFFSRGLATVSGAECSPTAVRGLIQEIIAAEPAHTPLSDVDIARQLDAQGFKVARRTVTKYRQLLKIEPAERRRHTAAHAA